MNTVFSCKRCGYCCHGETTVSLDEQDQENMLQVLNISREEALAKYWRQNGKVIQMKTIDGHCIFYDQGCTVHRGRPWRCREWPLVSAMVKDENNFEVIRNSCPGIFPETSYKEVCQVVQKGGCMQPDGSEEQGD